MEKKIPITFEDAEDFPHYGEMVLVKPGDTLLPIGYRRLANTIYNFEYRNEDICLFTYPKSGTNWVAQILWGMTHINELQRATTESVDRRLLLLDNDFLHDVSEKDYMERLRAKRPEAREDDGPALQLAALEKGRRLIWSHLPFNLHNPNILDKCKVVYVMRHPKDNMFSRYIHFNKVAQGPIQYVAETFMTGDTIYGSYWHHVNEAWKRKDHPNLHIMFYEDMKADIMAELEKLNQFLGTSLTEEQLKRVAELTSFNNMKDHPTMVVNIQGFQGSFLHKGEVGSSKGQLPPELDAQMDAWIKDNALRVDPAFRYLS
ncbi:luciferin sulfotransferase-like [Macrobrachium nipponense]|uniref:luciferin sulfotransferase-like n=1 Tax=Macrobrachium nipponense TaxID=159736 RepID=UPI0030C7C4E5